MTKNKMTEQQKIFLLMEEEAELDFLPPEQEETEEDAEALRILAEDKEQERWEQQARRAGLL